MSKITFINDAQRAAMGLVVTRELGAHMQTGVDADLNIPYIYTQLGPSFPVVHWLFHEDGTVLRDGVEQSRE